MAEREIALVTNGSPKAVLSYLVPGTGGLLAVHKSISNATRWNVTHVPTGRVCGIRCNYATKASAMDAGRWLWNRLSARSRKLLLSEKDSVALKAIPATVRREYRKRTQRLQ